ncbi:hypothetical protein L873DRAFT_1790135 [Choiromyces venosus 120613-1]|uniref:Uncharacterized protein n=1 Tax=Choiromyces venosus 120613-1 TaxID=1336337 RepID=A0A3N4JKM0_9PEZI|nr:hypothetical protein L873DRAFT_1790135 [Choiromyces venosus 120613-1]
MSITTQKGSVYWLDDTPGSRRANVDNGKLNHPVLVLGAITSFNNQSLSTRFPSPGDTERRRRYLPLRGGRGAATPHPDNGLLLSIITTGQPAMLSRQSYVNLEPFTVEVRHLSYLRYNSTCILPSDMLDLVIERLREFEPDFIAYQEISLPSRRPRTQQQPARPQPRPAPQIPPPQPSSYHTRRRQEDDHDDNPDPDRSLGSEICKYIAIAATLFSVRYFFR